MTTFLSSPPETATEGERSFYNRLEQAFENEDHLIAYFEPEIRGKRPDFLLISPKFGIFIIEIKDYLESNLKVLTKSGKWEIDNENGFPEMVDNPFDQIYQYWRVIKDGVNKCHFPPDVDIPIQCIVVFSNISKMSDHAKSIKELAPNRIIPCFKEDITRNEKFYSFLSDLIPSNLDISEEMFNAIRGNVIPTCRLPSTKQSDLMEYFSYEDQVKLIDIEQERLARELGEGHRLIFGVAGSGKTILLVARARILAKKHTNWKILILCYNRLLKSMLFNMLNPLDYEADITISTFHSWAASYILNSKNYFKTLYLNGKNTAEKEGKITEFFRDFVPDILMQLIMSQGEDKRQYDAILIDEAQDFDQSWFKPIVKVLNPETNSLLITCDGLQGIYDRKKFHWSEVGIQAKGRVKRFEKSYRIPIEIGLVAQATLPKRLKDLIDKYDEFLSTKEFVGNHGSVEIILSQNREEEYETLSEKISRFLTNPQEILILFKYNLEKKDYNHPLFDYLKKNNIQWKALKDHNFSSPGLLIGTLHGTKGLESDTIIIPEVDTYVSDKDRQLLYVGMTRSRKKLILSANRSTELIKNLENYNKP
ncbi:MAG: UvrD-helicase domain-containing protein [Candidatus Thorarchaeota archaeon]